MVLTAVHQGMGCTFCDTTGAWNFCYLNHLGNTCLSTRLTRSVVVVGGEQDSRPNYARDVVKPE